MLQLPNGCTCSDPTVTPANWKTSGASIKKNWRVTYRFRDPSFKEQYPNGKLVGIKKMNRFKTLGERRLATTEILDEVTKLLEEGYNPITNKISDEKKTTDISEHTPLVDALAWAFENKNAEPETMKNIKSVLLYFNKGLAALNLDRLPVGKVTRKHITQALKKTGEIKIQTDIVIDKTGRTKKGIWNSNQYNHSRKYISALFTELADVDACDGNPVDRIKKQNTLTKIRGELSILERQKVNAFVKENYFPFWRFLQIFFHSGARMIELLGVKIKDVDLFRQRFKVTVKKGNITREEWRTIKTIALPFWREILSLVKSGDLYLFSWGLVPGIKLNTRYQLTKRWRQHVKIKLGIDADMYSLKHSNLDEVAGELNLEEAQKLAGHKTKVITLGYTQGESDRKHNRLKEVNNAF